jgi:hypothetical protein
MSEIREAGISLYGLYIQVFGLTRVSGMGIIAFNVFINAGVIR